MYDFTPHSGTWKKRGIAPFIRYLHDRRYECWASRHRNFVPPWLSSMYLLRRRLCGDQSRSGGFGEETNLSPLPKIELLLLGIPSRILVTTSTDLSRPQYYWEMFIKYVCVHTDQRVRSIWYIVWRRHSDLGILLRTGFFSSQSWRRHHPRCDLVGYETVRYGSLWKVGGTYTLCIWCLLDRASLWWLKNTNQLDATYYFIVLLIGSTCFGHYFAHHQELMTIMLITRLVVSFLVCCRLEATCG